MKRVLISGSSIVFIAVVVFGLLVTHNSNQTEMNSEYKDSSDKTTVSDNAYEVIESLGQACQSSSDCQLPHDYAIQSRCPYESRCIENICTVICPYPFTGAKLSVPNNNNNVVLPDERVTGTISSFAECEAAGYDIMESYPRQCRDPQTNKTFTEKIPE